jgi:hypothetical protein
LNYGLRAQKSNQAPKKSRTEVKNNYLFVALQNKILN